MNGTTPLQRVVVAPLAELAQRSQEAGLAAPGVVVVGDVVRLREELAWFERLPLFGKRVLVTRDEGAGGRLAAALRDAGAVAVLAPLIRTAPPESWAELDAALDAAGEYDAVLLTSANAVRHLAARAAERGIDLAGRVRQVWCIGPGTAGVARECGLPVHALPETRFDAEGLLAAVKQKLSPAGRRFLFPCAAGARDVLQRGLVAAGAAVDAVVTYRTLPGDTSAADLRDRIAEGLDVLTFTSPSAVARFAELLGDASRVRAGRCIVAAIGPVTAEALRRLGLPPDVVAERAGMQELVAALALRLSDPARGTS